jgi:hypothetical protein
MINLRVIALATLPSLALGLGIGFSLAASDKPLVLEATNTPIGSIVIRYNATYADPYLIERQDGRSFHQTYIA